MKAKGGSIGDSLRKRAEKILSQKPQDLRKVPVKDIKKLIHELDVHQIELDMQNDELRRVQPEIELSRAKYIDLYDFAPVGYLTLSTKGLILEANLTAGTLLGVARGTLIKQPLGPCILNEDRGIYYRHLKQLFETGEPQMCEPRIVKKGGTIFWAHLTAVTAQDEQGTAACRVVISDITTRKRDEEKLRESEEKFKVIASSTPDHLLVQDRELRYSFVINPLPDLTEKDMIGKTDYDFLSKEDADKLTKIKKQVIKTGNPAHIETPLISLKGKEQVFDGSYVPKFNAEGRIDGLIGYFRNVTERKEAEEVLHRYELLSGHSRDIILFMECDGGRILEANAAATNAYGYTRDKLLTLTIQDLRAPDTHGLTADQMAEANARGILFETVHRRKDGSTFPVEVSSRGATTGATRTLISVIRDITKRKQSEHTLLLSEKRYRSYIDLTEQFGWTTNADGEVVEDFPSWRNFTGQSEEEVKGWGWSKALHPDDLEPTARIWRDAVTARKNYETEYRVRRYDGVYRSFLARGVPIFKDDGNIQEWVGTCIDITERRQIEDVRKFLINCGLPSSGEDFFKSLARYLAANLGMDYVCIDRVQGEGLVARTVAIYFDGKFEDNLTYALKDTPCGDVVKNTICCFPIGVRHLYPQDAILQEMAAESYAGTLLWSSKGKPIGLIAIIGRQPLANPKLAESMLNLVATRAAAELERREADEALRQQRLELQQLNETLEQRVSERTSELATSNEGLRQLSMKLLSAQEDERKRIGGELHDTIGSCLSAANFKIQDTLLQVAKNPNVVTESLNAIVPLIQEGIDECRRIQMDLRPPMLDDLGLLTTLSWFFKRFQTIYSGMQIEQEIGIEEVDVPLFLKTVIFRVTQEAMNNIAKYSKADLARLSLRKLDDRMELEIRDNGQGFDLETVKKGMGLSTMRERAQLSGGSFDLKSAMGKGTVIRASWPI